MSPLPPTTGGPADDDQHWLDLLAGRAAPQADAATRHEAQRLRTALLACQAEAPAGAPDAPEARIARLLSRAREATLLPVLPAAPAAPPPSSAPSSRSTPDAGRSWLDHWRAQAQAGGQALGWRGAAAGLALAALAVTLAVKQGLPEPAAPEVMRGSAQQQLTVPHPEEQQQALLAALRAAGFDAHPYTRLGRPAIDVALPVPLPPAQAQALARLGLAVPDGPSLQLELLPSAR